MSLISILTCLAQSRDSVPVSLLCPPNILPPLSPKSRKINNRRWRRQRQREKKKNQKTIDRQNNQTVQQSFNNQLNQSQIFNGEKVNLENNKKRKCDFEELNHNENNNLKQNRSVGNPADLNHFLTSLNTNVIQEIIKDLEEKNRNFANKPTNLTDDDIKVLLTHFKNLSTIEQDRLLIYFKQLETEDQDRIQNLKDFLSESIPSYIFNKETLANAQTIKKLKNWKPETAPNLNKSELLYIIRRYPILSTHEQELFIIYINKLIDHSSTEAINLKEIITQTDQQHPLLKLSLWESQENAEEQDFDISIDDFKDLIVENPPQDDDDASSVDFDISFEEFEDIDIPPDTQKIKSGSEDIDIPPDAQKIKLESEVIDVPPDTQKMKLAYDDDEDDYTNDDIVKKALDNVKAAENTNATAKILLQKLEEEENKNVLKCDSLRF